MMILDTLIAELVGFFQIGGLLQAMKTGDWSALSSRDWLLALTGPIIPVLVLVEFIVGLYKRNSQIVVYRVNLLIHIVNRVVGRLINLSVFVLVVTALSSYAVVQIPSTWYGFIYAYLVWELGHYIYHYLGHKVRLFWCLHSTHHAPEQMNLSVSYTHFFLEGTYANLIRVSVATLLGVPSELLILVLALAPLYGSFVHLGENMISEGRLGVLEKLVLTPSHHRVHHARNPLYIDRNYCNLFNVWDRLFGTYQELDSQVPPEYGITRPINSGSFFDVYFGEILALVKDVTHAPGIINKLRYLTMPPGWSHTGHHKTAKALRMEYLAARNIAGAASTPTV